MTDQSEGTPVADSGVDDLLAAIRDRVAKKQAEGLYTLDGLTGPEGQLMTRSSRPRSLQEPSLSRRGAVCRTVSGREVSPKHPGARCFGRPNPVPRRASRHPRIHGQRNTEDGRRQWSFRVDSYSTAPRCGADSHHR